MRLKERIEAKVTSKGEDPEVKMVTKATRYERVRKRGSN